MKTVLKYLLVLTCASCDLFDSKDPAPKTELEKLPPLTTSGENAFGCLVNGEALVVNNTMQITAIFQEGQLQLGGGVENKDIDKDVTMITGDPLVENEKYEVNDDPVFLAMYQIRSDNKSCRYEFENTYEGSITFSKIDRANFIISGIFEFSTVTTECDTIRITDGRFDVQYIP